jgi:site-specific DNA-methyltransferase (adenine-specific)
MMTSTRLDWETPPEIFDPLNAEFRFSLDVCATLATTKCISHYSPTDDALSRPWVNACEGFKHRCWMNPPYGRQIGKWVKKAYEESSLGGVVVCLLPARTDTAWWHDYCMKASEIRYIRGRLKFLQDGMHMGPAPFPSAIVIFRPESL